MDKYIKALQEILYSAKQERASLVLQGFGEPERIRILNHANLTVKALEAGIEALKEAQ